MTDCYLTLEEALDVLDPPLTMEELQHFVLGAGLIPAGSRYTGRRGRPAHCYRMSELMRLHAANIPLMPRYGGVNSGSMGWPEKALP